MLCMIWCHLYNLKNVKGMSLLVKLQVYFAKSNPPWVFFMIPKL